MAILATRPGNNSGGKCGLCAAIYCGGSRRYRRTDTGRTFCLQAGMLVVIVIDDHNPGCFVLAIIGIVDDLRYGGLALATAKCCCDQSGRQGSLGTTVAIVVVVVVHNVATIFVLVVIVIGMAAAAFVIVVVRYGIAVSTALTRGAGCGISSVAVGVEVLSSSRSCLAFSLTATLTKRNIRLFIRRRQAK